MLPGILGLAPDDRRTAFQELIPDSATDHSFLLRSYCPPADGLIEYFKLSDELKAAEDDYFDFTTLRILKAADVSAAVCAQFRNSKKDATAAALKAVPVAEIRKLFDGKTADLNLCDKIQVPIALLFNVLISPSDVSDFVIGSRPPGRVEIDEVDYAAGIATRRAAIDALKAKKRTLNDALGRFDDDGRDLWLCFAAALLHWNERAINPVDAAGRATASGEILALLGALKFDNAAECFHEEWYVPTDETRMYRTSAGEYFTTYSASKNVS